MRISLPGNKSSEKKGHKGEDGYILLDALVAVLIAAVGFGAALGGISLAARASAAQTKRMEIMIEERNTQTDTIPVIFPESENAY